MSVLEVKEFAVFNRAAQMCELADVLNRNVLFDCLFQTALSIWEIDMTLPEMNKGIKLTLINKHTNYTASTQNKFHIKILTPWKYPMESYKIYLHKVYFFNGLWRSHKILAYTLWSTP